MDFTDWIFAIQVCFVNNFSDLWEYEQAFEAGTIEFTRYIGESCPVCGKKGCYRRIGSYERGVIELFPFRMYTIHIARFLCTTRKLTFSLLPHQLAPYHRYTIASMLQAVCLFFRIAPGAPLESLYDQLPDDCLTTLWLMRCWRAKAEKSLQRAFHVLSRYYVLDTLPGSSDKAVAFLGYLSAFSPRGPPESAIGIERAVKRYSQSTGRHFLGISSQERRRASI